MYETKWSGCGTTSVAYISGPGVESLRLDSGDNLDVSAIEEALRDAFMAGRADTHVHCGQIGHTDPGEETTP